MRPTQEHATNNGQTYMVSSSTWGRRNLLQKDSWAKLLIDVLYHYRGSAYLLHEFVVMPDHIHVLFTPKTSLEKAVQFIKGGFSYRANKELGSNMEIWQKGFPDHRIPDASDYRLHQIYIQQNPVRKNLCASAEEFPCSSAHSGFDVDDVPQRLKPASFHEHDVARLQAAPFQKGKPASSTSEAAPFQNKTSNDVLIGRDSGIAAPQGPKPISSNANDAARLEGAPLQSRIKNKTA